MTITRETENQYSVEGRRLMDPNANLREQEILITDRAARGRYLSGDAARLTELRQALYDWIHDGGFEPDWATYPNAAKYFRVD